MNTALIVERNEDIVKAITLHLREMGYCHFLLAATEQDAVVAADEHALSLVVIGDRVDEGSALGAGRRIAAKHDVPMLLATSHGEAARHRLSDMGILEGPFALDAMHNAVRHAAKARSMRL